MKIYHIRDTDGRKPLNKLFAKRLFNFSLLLFKLEFPKENVDGESFELKLKDC